MPKKIGEIKEILQSAFENGCYEKAEEFRTDERKGVQTALASFDHKIEKLKLEKKRVKAMRSYEDAYPTCSYICGIDEVGRGPLAGPVVAAAVILPKDCEILYINDSKKLSEKKREELFIEIKEKAIAIGIGMASVQTIDEKNILKWEEIFYKRFFTQQFKRSCEMRFLNWK